jgi:4-methyl-5(b-hydroxyethyl)-thiazole monophosphate biosynthesis
MRVLVPLADGFEETEFATIVDLLRRAEIEVVTASLTHEIATGSHNIKIIADVSLDKIESEKFDAIVLPGGFPGFRNLGEDERILKIIRDMNKADKYIAAICGAPSVLAKAGIFEGRRSTVHPSGKEEIQACTNYVDERVVVDGRLITSQAPGTAMEFALKLIELFLGADKMETVKAQVLAIC